MRWLLKEFVPRAGLFGAAMSMGRLVKPALPAMLKDKVPDARPAGAWPASRHSRKMIALAGCAQPSMAPSINAATARVLDALGISLVEMPGSRLLRGGAISPQRPTGRPRRRAAQYRCLVAGCGAWRD